MPSFACARCGAALNRTCRCPAETQRDATWVLAEEVVVLRMPQAAPPAHGAPANVAAGAREDRHAEAPARAIDAPVGS